jgi:transposase
VWSASHGVGGVDSTPTVVTTTTRNRRLIRARGITLVITRHGLQHDSGPGTVRWPVERTFVWLKGIRRLRVHTERRTDVHQPSHPQPVLLNHLPAQTHSELIT